MDYRQRYIDFSRVTVAAPFADGVARSTCPAAIGTAFAAGTEDGRGLDGFNEGDLAGNPFFQALGGIIAPAPQWVRDCQGVKPVLLSTGTQTPFPWSPEVLPVSIVRIGQLAIIAAPAEFTIMAGRRVRDTVRAALGADVRHLVFAGYSNAYSGYVTTPEEYDAQHYEGASTHFGKWTLGAYQQSFHELASALRQSTAVGGSAAVRDLSGNQMSFQTGVVLDNTPVFKSFGDVVQQANASYSRGQRVEVSFWTGHPKNNLRLNGTLWRCSVGMGRRGARWRWMATGARLIAGCGSIRCGARRRRSLGGAFLPMQRPGSIAFGTTAITRTAGMAPSMA